MSTFVTTTRVPNRGSLSVSNPSEPDVSPSPLHTADVRSFAEFYRIEFPAMVSLASTLVGRSAEDVAQEAMIRAHAKWDLISGYDNPGTWVRRVTINLATSTLRRRATRLRKLAHLIEGTPTVTWETSIDDDLAAAIQTLSKNQRAAVVLHYLEDLPVAEIARILEVSPSTAKVHLHRGRLALAERLSHESNASSPTKEALR